MNDYAESNNLDVTNPAPRCPVILMLDTSGSMSGAPLRVPFLRSNFTFVPH